MADIREVREAGDEPLRRRCAINVHKKGTEEGNHGFPGKYITAKSCNWVAHCEYIARVEGAKDAATKAPALFTKVGIPAANGLGRDRAKEPSGARPRSGNETGHRR